MGDRADPLADPAEADDAEGLAGDVAADELGPVVVPPLDQRLICPGKYLETPIIIAKTCSATAACSPRACRRPGFPGRSRRGRRPGRSRPRAGRSPGGSGRGPSERRRSSPAVRITRASASAISRWRTSGSSDEAIRSSPASRSMPIPDFVHRGQRQDDRLVSHGACSRVEWGRTIRTVRSTSRRKFRSSCVDPRGRGAYQRRRGRGNPRTSASDRRPGRGLERRKPASPPA